MDELKGNRLDSFENHSGNRTDGSVTRGEEKDRLTPESLSDEQILIYRGIDRTKKGDRAGKWWTTNPYYALRKVEKRGQMFVARISREEIARMARDVSLEAEYENYNFGDSDPASLRLVTEGEIQRLKEKMTFAQAPVGGGLAKEPEDPVAVGKEIFEDSFSK